jgi:glycosyltransferase involved in cell wall biosynthesis
MSRICLYYRALPATDRWWPGDRYLRALARRAIRGAPRASGLDKVFANLRLGLDRLAIPYEVNRSFRELRRDDRIAVLGRGRGCLEDYDLDIPIVAGIGVITHPSEWPDLCEQRPIARYLQHSAWSADIYRPYFKDRCVVWPVGIDTLAWRPAEGAATMIDFLIYDKIMWDRPAQVERLLVPIRHELAQRHLSFLELRYGQYDAAQYRRALRRCSAMIFLCEHESQGLAYQEALAADVPILAWDQGCYLDPRQLGAVAAATSVPYFDGRCGLTFRTIKEFPHRLGEFLELKAERAFAPRDYVLENLTVEKCALSLVRILDDAQMTGSHDLHHQ